MRPNLTDKGRYNQKSQPRGNRVQCTPAKTKTTARLDDAVYHRMGESPMAMGSFRAYGSVIGAGHVGRSGHHLGEQRRVGSQSAAVGENREGKAEKKARVWGRICLASRVGVDATGMGRDGSAQRGLVDAGVSERSLGMERVVFAAVGRVDVEGVGSGLAQSRKPAVVQRAGPLVGRGQSLGADRVGSAVVDAA